LILLFQLTSDVEVEVIALSVSLCVVRDAGVDPAVGPRHLLKDEALVRNDYLLGDVVVQLATLGGTNRVTKVPARDQDSDIKLTISNWFSWWIFFNMKHEKLLSYSNVKYLMVINDNNDPNSALGLSDIAPNSNYINTFEVLSCGPRRQYLKNGLHMTHQTLRLSHIVLPRDLVRPRTGLDPALKVDVVALFDVGSVQAGAEQQGGAGNVWKT
jgi:hypothetical protein